MADAPSQLAPDLASQEAKRLELDRQRKQQSWVGRQATSLLASGAMALGSVPTADHSVDPSADVRGGSAAATDQDATRQAREARMEGQLRQSRFRDRTQAAQAPKGGGLTMKDAMSLAKNPTPAGLAMKLAAPTGGTGPGGIPMGGEDLKKMIGNGLIKMSWSNLWLTFGHSIYVIDIMFFAGWASKYLRQYIPEVGREWFPGEVGKRMPEHVILPLKLGEIVAMGIITFGVLMIDLLILAAFAFLLGAILDVARNL